MSIVDMQFKASETNPYDSIYMKNIKYPVNFLFKISTFANDFTATDECGHTFAYVRQKMFKLKEDIQIYHDESRTKMLFKIKADRWLDFSAAYTFSDDTGNEIGKLVRKGWRSMWKARYEIFGENKKQLFHINEKSAMVRVMDNVFGEIPILGLLTGYIFNPTYIVTDFENQTVVELIKKPSFFGRKFEITATGKLREKHNDKIILGLMMMILLERRRG